MVFSIRYKISGLTAVILILFAAIFTYSAVREMKNVISEERSNDFSERIRIIIDELDETVINLEKTGLTEIFEDDFKKNVIELLKQRYYIGYPSNGAQNSDKYEKTDFYPIILDENNNLIMHPELEQEIILFDDADQTAGFFNSNSGSFNYKKNGIDEWMVYSKFGTWNWTIIYSCEKSLKYAAVTSFFYKILLYRNSIRCHRNPFDVSGRIQTVETT